MDTDHRLSWIYLTYLNVLNPYLGMIDVGTGNSLQEYVCNTPSGAVRATANIPICSVFQNAVGNLSPKHVSIRINC